MMDLKAADPKGLLRESFRIEGITEAECRSIFVDWALALPEGVEERAALRCALAAYGAEAPGHPMSRVIAEGLERPVRPALRRGGPGGRRGTVQ